MRVRPAKKSDLSDVVDCAERIKREYFLRHDIPQWNDGYPSKEDFAADIEAERLFVMYLGEALIGFISVGVEHEPTYDIVGHMEKRRKIRRCSPLRRKSGLARNGHGHFPFRHCKSPLRSVRCSLNTRRHPRKERSHDTFPREKRL